MRSSALLEILEAVDLIETDDQSKKKFKLLVITIGSNYGVKGVEHADRVSFAARLLSLKTSRSTIRDRLRALYGVSRRSAYRIIGDALQLCHLGAKNGTQTEDDSNNEFSFRSEP